MKCEKCGFESGTRFCPKCGQALSSDASFVETTPISSPVITGAKGRNSLGIWAFVVSLVVFWRSALIYETSAFYIALVLFAATIVLIALAFKRAARENQKTGLTIAAVVFCAFSGLMLLYELVIMIAK